MLCRGRPGSQRHTRRLPGFRAGRSCSTGRYVGGRSCRHRAAFSSRRPWGSPVSGTADASPAAGRRRPRLRARLPEAAPHRASCAAGPTRSGPCSRAAGSAPGSAGRARLRGERGLLSGVPGRRGELLPPALRRGAVPRGPRRLGHRSSSRTATCAASSASTGRSARGARAGGGGSSELAEMMLDLQRRGCHNVNVVSPTHYSAHDRGAPSTLRPSRGLRLPLVYNTVRAARSWRS